MAQAEWLHYAAFERSHAWAEPARPSQFRVNALFMKNKACFTLGFVTKT